MRGWCSHKRGTTDYDPREAQQTTTILGAWCLWCKMVDQQCGRSNTLTTWSWTYRYLCKGPIVIQAWSYMQSKKEKITNCPRQLMHPTWSYGSGSNDDNGRKATFQTLWEVYCWTLGGGGGGSWGTGGTLCTFPSVNRWRCLCAAAITLMNVLVKVVISDTVHHALKAKAKTVVRADAPTQCSKKDSIGGGIVRW